MEIRSAIVALSALAQPTRLDVFRLLVKHEPQGIASGELARALDVPPNTMSTHLAILQQAGLAVRARRSRSVIYRARLEAIQQLVTFLLKDCCNGQPALCAPILEDLNSSLAGSTCCNPEAACRCSNAT